MIYKVDDQYVHIDKIIKCYPFKGFYYPSICIIYYTGYEQNLTFKTEFKRDIVLDKITNLLQIFLENKI